MAYGDETSNRNKEAMQNEVNTMHNMKLQRDKINQGMADGEHSRSAQQCRVKVNNQKQKSRKFCDSNNIYGNQRQGWEMFELMARVLGCKPTSIVDSMPRFRLRRYPE